MKRELSESALIRAIQKRSWTGAENLYDCYAKTLFKVITCLVNTPASAELTLEQILETIWTNIQDFNLKNSSFLLWMAGIAKAQSKRNAESVLLIYEPLFLDLVQESVTNIFDHEIAKLHPVLPRF